MRGRPRGASDSLKRAVEQGFRDATALEREEAFNFLRSDATLKMLLEEIRKSH